MTTKRLATHTRSSSAAIELPPAALKGTKSLEECLRARRSCRSFDPEPLLLEHASQLLWAAQGITGLGGLRTAPSPGAFYAIHAYLIAMDVASLRPGVYAYDPDRHIISLWKAGDLRSRLRKAACDQEECETASAAILLAAHYGRVKREFGENGPRLVCLEAGHIGQNICLQATALGIGALTYGKTDPAEMKRVVDLPEPEEASYLILVGPKY
jgi:SagB-type dehydrogenase family enzyme